MKSLTFFLILFIIKSSLSKTNLNKYSINIFIDNLKRKGEFEIIKSIKAECSSDVAIITCQVLNEGNCGQCQNVVIYYMPPYEPEVVISAAVHELTSEQKVAIQKILNKKFTKAQTKSLYDKIIKKTKKSINH